jgi:hypothetical protein
MAPSRRIVAIVALATLAFTACSSNDAKAGDIEDAMTDVGLTTEQARCVAREIDSKLDQDGMNELASAESPDDYPEGAQEVVDDAFSTCDVTDSTGTTEGDSSDTTGSDTTDTTGDEGTTATTEG